MVYFLGILSNTVPLTYTENHSHVLSVVAKDCGGKTSAPLIVVVKVTKPCKNGWSGMLTKSE